MKWALLMIILGLGHNMGHFGEGTLLERGHVGGSTQQIMKMEVASLPWAKTRKFLANIL